MYISLLIEINECESSPCLNGASCVDNINRYSCSCLAEYTDPECATGAVVFLHVVAIIDKRLPKTTVVYFIVSIFYDFFLS